MSYFITEDCTTCGACADLCKAKAIQQVDGYYSINEDKCEECGACAEACFLEAIRMRAITGPAQTDTKEALVEIGRDLKTFITKESPLKGRSILAVDDETDVLDTIEDELDICTLAKVADYDTAVQHLVSYHYDIVILDIMGVNGFELLRIAVARGMPAVMLTAHAITPEALKKSMELGAVFFLPKEKLGELRTFLEEIVLESGKPIWEKLFDQLGDYFKKRFGADGIKKDQLFKELVETYRQEGKARAYKQ